MANFQLINRRPAASLIFLLLFLFSTVICYPQLTPSHGIIPVPVSINVHPGNFLLSEETHITWSNDEDSTTIVIFNQQLKNYYSTGLLLSKGNPRQHDVIRLQRVFTDDLPPVAYKIFIDDQQVTISAVNGAGIFYGLQTLLQLIPAASSNPLLIPLISIIKLLVSNVQKKNTIRSVCQQYSVGFKCATRPGRSH
ncbi:MAG: glycoside hydrolase family 20 zincin-like fold domain-containing protein [Chitinophagales bacterium]